MLSLVAAGLFLFARGPQKAPEKPRTVSTPLPGMVEDKDAWRAQEAAREKATENLIEEVRNQLKAQQEKSEQLAQALEAVKVKQRDQPTVTLDAPLPLPTPAHPPLPPLPAENSTRRPFICAASTRTGNDPF